MYVQDPPFDRATGKYWRLQTADYILRTADLLGSNVLAIESAIRSSYDQQVTVEEQEA